MKFIVSMFLVMVIFSCKRNGLESQILGEWSIVSFSINGYDELDSSSGSYTMNLQDGKFFIDLYNKDGLVAFDYRVLEEKKEMIIDKSGGLGLNGSYQVKILEYEVNPMTIQYELVIESKENQIIAVRQSSKPHNK